MDPNSPGNSCGAIQTTNAKPDNIGQTRSNHSLYLRVSSFGGYVVRIIRPNSGASVPFVDPDLNALDAPVCWMDKAGALALDAVSRRRTRRQKADIDLGRLDCVQHIVIGWDSVEHILFRKSDQTVTFRLVGARASIAPVCLTYRSEGNDAACKNGLVQAELPRLLAKPARWTIRTREQLLLRDAVIALDGRQAGASYREIAIAMVGVSRAKEAWSSASRALKERVRRARTKGEAMRDDGYRTLIY